MKAKTKTYLVELCWADGSPIFGARVLIHASKCEIRDYGPDARYRFNFVLLLNAQPVYIGIMGLEVCRLALWNESTEQFEDMLTLEDLAG